MLQHFLDASVVIFIGHVYGDTKENCGINSYAETAPIVRNRCCYRQEYFKCLSATDANKTVFIRAVGRGGHEQWGLSGANCIPDVGLGKSESSGVTSATGAAIQLVDFTPT